MIALYFHMCTTLLSAVPLSLGFPQAPVLLTWSEVGLLLGVAACSFFGQLFLTRAMQLENAGMISSLNFSQVCAGGGAAAMPRFMAQHLWPTHAAPLHSACQTLRRHAACLLPRRHPFCAQSLNILGPCLAPTTTTTTPPPRRHTATSSHPSGHLELPAWHRCPPRAPLTLWRARVTPCCDWCEAPLLRAGAFDAPCCVVYTAFCMPDIFTATAARITARITDAICLTSMTLPPPSHTGIVGVTVKPQGEAAAGAEQQQGRQAACVEEDQDPSRMRLLSSGQLSSGRLSSCALLSQSTELASLPSSRLPSIITPSASLTALRQPSDGITPQLLLPHQAAHALPAAAAADNGALSATALPAAAAAAGGAESGTPPVQQQQHQHHQRQDLISHMPAEVSATHAQHRQHHQY